MKKKHFKKAVGFYYFHLSSGKQDILIKRPSKEEAYKAYFKYVKNGKNCEWLGKWDGKEYKDPSPPQEKRA